MSLEKYVLPNGGEFYYSRGEGSRVTPPVSVQDEETTEKTSNLIQLGLSEYHVEPETSSSLIRYLRAELAKVSDFQEVELEVGLKLEGKHGFVLAELKGAIDVRMKVKWSDRKDADKTK